ncbi:MAG: hypothetical protein ABJ364_14720 [Lentilitoribacter sp.]
MSNVSGFGTSISSKTTSIRARKLRSKEELEGRSESLKAYAIALDVMGRRADFDPSTDSIVRVEVAR